MAVYVDDMYKSAIGQFGRMKMSHLTADTTAELIAMVDRIGVQRKWIQYPGTWKEHFDIALSKRKLAVEAGAVEIEYGSECAKMDMRRRATGLYGPPEDAAAWYDEQQKLKSIAKDDHGQPGNQAGPDFGNGVLGTRTVIRRTRRVP